MQCFQGRAHDRLLSEPCRVQRGSRSQVNENYLFEGGLYDLRRDPGERYNVMESYPEIVAGLVTMAREARDDLGDDLTGNPGKNRREPGRVK